ncbi:MAG TPA: class I SAM-dependent methyltransferase [Planctomycetota bacterium]|mgnify:CR=1 FL=1|nr:class I SAM-dependent methyltransferase [Planctomycetota bacterium]
MPTESSPMPVVSVAAFAQAPHAEGDRMPCLVKDGHLGGFVAGGDPKTCYPRLWDWMVNELSIRSVLDVGCGEGHAVRHFSSLGCEAFGIDGSRKAGRLLKAHEFVVHDLADGPCRHRNPFDAVWCCEVAEHIEERHVHHLLATLADNALRFVFFTHALPGQGGHHHVNCRAAEYWLELFRAYGCRLDDALTAQARSLAHSYFARTGLVHRSRPRGE